MGPALQHSVTDPDPGAKMLNHIKIILHFYSFSGRIKYNALFQNIQ